MSEDELVEVTPTGASTPLVKKGRRVSSVWIVPLIAAAVGGGLYYKSMQEAGQKIELHFSHGSGIDAHKTHIVYNGVSVGVVDHVALAEGNKGVIVEAELVHSAVHMAAEGSQFWLVQPRIGLGGISGLDTLLSGNYIAIQPGNGNKATHFKALSEPPAEDPGARGLKVVLVTDILNVASKGNPIYYRHVPVGIVQSHELTEDKNYIRIHALVYEKYADLVKTESLFWDVSGFEVNAGLDGVKIRAESLASMLAGGIAFDTPIHLSESELAPEGSEFALFENETLAFRRGSRISLHMGTSEGLRKGSVVKYKGFEVGEIERMEIKPDLSGVTAHVFVHESANNIAVDDSKFWIVRPKVGLSGVSGLDTIVTGNYIEVLPGSGVNASEFTLLKQPPNYDGAPTTDEDPDYNLTLVASRLGSLKPGVPVFFRDIKVGQVSGAQLSPHSDSVHVQVSIKNKYAPLIRERTHFYNASGFGMDVGLLGAKFKAASMSAILDGGIGFATPGTTSRPAMEDSTFILFDEPEEDWLTWAPSIPLGEKSDADDAIAVNQLQDSNMTRRIKNLKVNLGPIMSDENEK